MATVCIDSGHIGKANMCPNNPNYYESVIMWKLHLLQKTYLEQMGIKVILTRSNINDNLSVTDRGKKANGCDLFISNHTNAVGGGMNESVDHVAVYHLTNDDTTTCDEYSKEFAERVGQVIADTMGISTHKILTRKAESDRNNDGFKNDNYYGVLHGSRMVNVSGVILEHGFHTHTKTVEWLLNDNNLDKLARAEAECIAKFLLGDDVPLNNKPIVESDTIYRVQVGAFKVKANADKMLVKVKEAGFTDAFITTNKK